MKFKDTNFIQLHIEKLILGIGALALLWIVFAYVLGNPYATELDGQSVAPAKVPHQVLADARQLRDALRAGKGISLGSTPAYAPHFQSRVESPVVKVVTLVPIGHQGLPADLGPAGSYPTYVLPHPPTTSNLVAEVGYGALGPISNADIQQKLVQLIGDSRSPYDFRYVSVAATFNLNQWKRQFNSVSASPDQRIPRRWFYPALAGVYLRRQQLDSATGKWGHTTIIKPIPGQLGFTNQSQKWSVRTTENNLKLVVQHQPAVAEPQFVPLAHGAQWWPPDLAPYQLKPRDERRLRNLRLQIQLLKRRQTDLQRRIHELSPTNSSRRGPNGNNNDSLRQQRLAQIYQSLHNLQLQLFQQLVQRNKLLGLAEQVPEPPRVSHTYAHSYQRQRRQRRQRRQQQQQQQPPDINNLGGAPGGIPELGAVQNPPARRRRRRPAQSSPRLPRQVQRQMPQLPDGQFRVWAHDLTAQPGATYRYQVIVSVLNPLFQRNAVAPKQKKQNFNKFAIAPAPDALAKAPWSKPVHIAPRHYFFFVAGSAARRLAKVQVWRIYDGIWRNATFSERPGDPIGGSTRITLPRGAGHAISLNIGDLMVDLVQSTNARNGNQLTSLLYLNEGSGRIGRHTLQADVQNPIRIHLENQQAGALEQVKGLRSPYASPFDKTMTALRSKRNRAANYGRSFASGANSYNNMSAGGYGGAPPGGYNGAPPGGYNSAPPNY